METRVTRGVHFVDEIHKLTRMACFAGEGNISPNSCCYTLSKVFLESTRLQLYTCLGFNCVKPPKLRIITMRP